MAKSIMQIVASSLKNITFCTLGNHNTANHDKKRSLLLIAGIAEARSLTQKFLKVEVLNLDN